jgi:hypothetical protein
VIAGDHDALQHAAIGNELTAVAGPSDTAAAIVLALEALIKASVAQDMKRREDISTGIGKFYCEQIAAGK